MRLRVAWMPLVLTAGGAVPLSSQTLETRGGQPAVVLDVAHIEKGNKYCFGKIEIRRDQILYKVEQPANRSDHGWELNRSVVLEARPGEQGALRYAEIRLPQGMLTQFFHSASYENGVYQLDANNPAVFTLAAAVTDFDATVKTLKAGTRIKVPEREEGPKVDLDKKAIRFLVSHSDKQDTYCYGWLEVSAKEIAYDVLWPKDRTDHGWRLARTDVAGATTVDRNNWRWIEIKTTRGQVEAFGTGAAVEFGYYLVLPQSYGIFEAVKAIQSFDSTWASLTESTKRTAPTRVAPQTPPDEPATKNVQYPCKATVYIRSDPAGPAEVFVDGSFMGSLPAKLELNEGQPTIIVRLKGYPQWERSITISCNAVINVVANLK